MNHFARLPLCAGVAVVLVFTLVFLLMKLGGQRTEENLNFAQWAVKLGDELQRREELDTRGAPVFRRTVEKRRIVQDLLAHHLTLGQAVQEFRELEEQVAQAEPNEQARPSLDEDSLRRSVIVWARAELAQQPAEAKQVLDEIESEMSKQPSSEE